MVNQPGTGLSIGFCFQCGKLTEQRFDVGWRTQRAPFCHFGHAHTWAKQQGIPKASVRRSPPRR